MSNPADNVKSLSPRVRRALELYGTAMVPTKKAASTEAGLHPQYLTMLTAANPIVKEYLDNVNAQVQEKSIDMGALLHKLSLRALDRIAETMENGSSELLRFKAAQDLADRGPQSMKSSKVQVDGGLMIATADAKAIAAAMVEAAEVRKQYSLAVTSGNDDTTGSFGE